MIFNYGYGCCAFVHNICGRQLVVPDGIPDTSNPLSQEFFINPRCPPGVVPTKAATVDVCSGEAMIALDREVPTAILKTNISEAVSISLPPRLGWVMSLILLLRVTRESEKPDVSFGN